MEIDQQKALKTLMRAQALLNAQDITVLPRVAQVQLLAAQRATYQEIQAQQVRKMAERNGDYVMVSHGLKTGESGFRAIHDWARSAAQTGAAVDGLLRGLSLLLMLF